MAINGVSVLDCTLRDGGYINDWNFGRKSIQEIIQKLVEANIDIIECGFIRGGERNVDSSVYSSMTECQEVIFPKSTKTLYAVMIEQHNYRSDLVSDCSEHTADIIRLTFRRNEWIEAKKTVKELIGKGYKVCIQPVGTASYDDQSLINLLQDVNELQPYAFYLVDTLGVMYQHEMRKFFYLIDNNLSKNICLGFHSHNNLQMSFANAQEMMRLNTKRSIIIDSSCYGMGRGVGNLATELITDYINNVVGQKYSITPILNVVDKCLMPIYAQQRWGYDVPFFLSASFKCHPNYAVHLIRKETLGIEKIEKLLSLIPSEKRNEYDASLMESLYIEMQKCDIDDQDAYRQLYRMIDSKDVIIIGSGSSIVTRLDKILKAMEGKFVISCNFIPESFVVDALFISNEKRLGTVDFTRQGVVMATSNLKSEVDRALIFNYSSLLGEGDASDNAGAMLIRILKNGGVRKIYLAGFDGFDVDSSNNYAVDGFKKSMDYDVAMKKNNDICKQLKLALSGVEYEFVTPSKYEIGDF